MYNIEPKSVLAIAPVQSRKCWSIQLTSDAFAKLAPDVGKPLTLNEKCEATIRDASSMTIAAQTSSVIRLHYLPLDVDLELVKKFVVDTKIPGVTIDRITRETHYAEHLKHSASGVIRVKISHGHDVKDRVADLYGFAMIGSYRALASIVGLPVRCVKCRQFGHIQRSCTAEKCKKCKAFTHATEKCSMAAAISAREQEKKLAENVELDDEIVTNEEEKVTQQASQLVSKLVSLGSVSRFEKRECIKKRAADDDITPQKGKGQRPDANNTSHDDEHSNISNNITLNSDTTTYDDIDNGDNNELPVDLEEEDRAFEQRLREREEEARANYMQWRDERQLRQRQLSEQKQRTHQQHQLQQQMQQHQQVQHQQDSEQQQQQIQQQQQHQQQQQQPQLQLQQEQLQSQQQLHQQQQQLQQQHQQQQQLQPQPAVTQQENQQHPLLREEPPARLVSSQSQSMIHIVSDNVLLATPVHTHSAQHSAYFEEAQLNTPKPLQK